MIKSGIIANTEGGKAACTLEYVENNSENDRLTAILDNKDVRPSITYEQMIESRFLSLPSKGSREARGLCPVLTVKYRSRKCGKRRPT